MSAVAYTVWFFFALIETLYHVRVTRYDWIFSEISQYTVISTLCLLHSGHLQAERTFALLASRAPWHANMCHFKSVFDFVAHVHEPGCVELLKLETRTIDLYHLQIPTIGFMSHDRCLFDLEYWSIFLFFLEAHQPSFWPSWLPGFKTSFTLWNEMHLNFPLSFYRGIATRHFSARHGGLQGVCELNIAYCKWKIKQIIIGVKVEGLNGGTK